MHIENDLNASWIVVQWNILNEIFLRGQSVILVLAWLELLEFSDSLHSFAVLSLGCDAVSLMFIVRLF